MFEPCCAWNARAVLSNYEVYERHFVDCRSFKIIEEVHRIPEERPRVHCSSRYSKQYLSNETVCLYGGQKEKKNKNISLILLSTITVHAQWNAHIWADVTDHCCYKLTFSFCVFASLSYLGSVGVYWRKFCVFAYFAFFVFSVEFGWMSFITSAIDCLKNCLRNHLLCVECDLKETDSLARSWRVHEVSPRGEGLPEMCTIEKNEKEFTKKCCF